MRIRIPKKLKINKKKAIDAIMILGGVVLTILIFAGIIYLSSYLRYKVIYEYRESQCVNNFTSVLNEEIIPLTTANVTGCICHYDPVDANDDTEPMCLCSCILYDEFGTLIDDDWNPLFSVI